MNEINTHQGIIPWFARNSVAANLLMIVIIFVGIGSAMTIQRAMQPDFDINVISIVTPYPGATPEEVEDGVILKIEEALQDIDAIERIEATADQSLGTVSVYIFEGEDLMEALDEVKSAVEGIISFPQQAERPIVKRVEVQKHTLFIQLSGDKDPHTMKALAEQIKEEILQDPDIAYVRLTGIRDAELSVEIPEYRLLEYGLTLADVSEAIQRSSLDIPGGTIKTANGNISLRTLGQARRQAEFEKIVLRSFPDGTRITIGDIATIRDDFVEEDRFSFFDRHPSVGVQVFTVGNQDLITVSDAAHRYLEKKQQHMPEGVKADLFADASFYLHGRLDMMISNLSMGALLVFVVLGLFLNIKLAFWVMVGLPICFLGTFAMMPVVGINLNMLSLFGFILVLGIVVDDAIIIGESAYAETEKHGHSLDSVVRGTLRVATPATFGVLTTIMAFSPTLFASGPFASFPASVGWVVILCLGFSLVESKWILPAHLAHSKPGTTGLWRQLDRLPRRANRVLSHFVENHYRPFIKKAIAQRYVTAASFVGMLILTAGLVLGGIVHFVMLPDVPGDFIQADLEMVEGTPEHETRRAYKHLEDTLYDIDREYTESEAAKGHQNRHLVEHIAAFGSSERNATIMVELTKNEKRDIDGDEITRRWRERVGALPGVKTLSIKMAMEQAGPSISLKLTTDHPDDLRAAANDLAEALAQFDGVYDIRNGASAMRDEIVLEIKPEAQSLGLTSAMLGSQVRNAFYGAEAQRVQRGDEEVKVMVRLPRGERESVADLQNMYIRSPDNTYVPLSNVAELTVQPGYARLARIDGERSISVGAYADKARIEPGAVVKDLLENTVPRLQQQYPGLEVRKSGESMESESMFISLLVGFALALFGIYGLLAVPLSSYTQPLIIMGVIPFGIIGAVFGHMVLGLSFSMMSFFGIIALSGVVVNDSLIMVDFINKAIARGVDMADAVVDAGCQRFRAILLTSLTTFFGLLPMLLESSLQAQFVIPMAVSLGFGIVFATVITLILIPCLYFVLDDFHKLLGARGPVERQLEAG
ncbi:efflux RND transporter permease subunit [Spongiibacter thalassae]|uniref:efflux RND transporter permease subunit n=1 Tax=Spongiibacter thalassae TaxID=2721624 RepID=UPI001B2FEB70|nr:efflux RND transporter permease subunit [Spongiibacter thalassae]